MQPVPNQTLSFVSYEYDDQVGISIVPESCLLQVATSSIGQILPWAYAKANLVHMVRSFCSVLRYHSLCFSPLTVTLYMSIGRVLIVSSFLVPIQHFLFITRVVPVLQVSFSH